MATKRTKTTPTQRKAPVEPIYKMGWERNDLEQAMVEAFQELAHLGHIIGEAVDRMDDMVMATSGHLELPLPDQSISGSWGLVERAAKAERLLTTLRTLLQVKAKRYTV